MRIPKILLLLPEDGYQKKKKDRKLAVSPKMRWMAVRITKPGLREEEFVTSQLQRAWLELHSHQNGEIPINCSENLAEFSR